MQIGEGRNFFIISMPLLPVLSVAARSASSGVGSAATHIASNRPLSCKRLLNSQVTNDSIDVVIMISKAKIERGTQFL